MDDLKILIPYDQLVDLLSAVKEIDYLGRDILAIQQRIIIIEKMIDSLYSELNLK